MRLHTFYQKKRGHSRICPLSLRPCRALARICARAGAHERGSRSAGGAAACRAPPGAARAAAWSAAGPGARGRGQSCRVWRRRTGRTAGAPGRVGPRPAAARGAAAGRALRPRSGDPVAARTPSAALPQCVSVAPSLPAAPLLCLYSNRRRRRARPWLAGASSNCSGAPTSSTAADTRKSFFKCYTIDLGQKLMRTGAKTR
jgi:hypothetical protein